MERLEKNTQLPIGRDLALFYAFRLFATSYLWVPILVKFKIARGLSFNQVMILGAIYSGVVIVMELPTGAFADRMGRRASMMVGAAAMVVSCLIAYLADSFTIFLLAEVFAAVSMSLCSGADSAYLYDLLRANGRKHEYPRHEATASAWHQVGSALAFAGGGFLAYHSLALPYLVTAVVAGIALVLALFMRDEKVFVDRRRRPSTQGRISAMFAAYRTHQWGALKTVLKSGPLCWIILYSAVVFLLLRAAEFMYQPYLESRGYDLREVGLVFAGAYAVAAFVARSTIWLRQYASEKVLLWGLLVTLAVTYAAMDELGGSLVLLVLLLQAVANGLYSPIVKPIINRNVHDSEFRASILSVESIGRRLGIVMVWPVIGLTGGENAMRAYGIVGLCGVCLLIILSSRLNGGGKVSEIADEKSGDDSTQAARAV